MRRTTVLLVVVVLLGAGTLVLDGCVQKSEQELKIDELRKELRAAQTTYRQAGRAAGMSGLDTTADAQAALDEVDRISKELAELKRGIETEVLKTAVERLEQEIDDFKRELR